MSIVQILLYISLVATILYIIWDLFLFHFRGKTPAISPHQQRNLRNLYLMVPALNEANTIGFTVKTILKDLKHLQLDRVKLVVIDDGSDDGTGEVLRHFKDPDLHVITRKMPTARHGKGDALNTGLEYIRNQVQDDEASATLIGVIDADSQPNQVFFEQVVHAYNYSDRDMLQTGVHVYEDHSWWTILQNFGFNTINRLAQTARSQMQSAIASGNGQFMTYEMATTIGWSRSALLDDMDCSLRGMLHGYKAVFLPNVSVPQMGVHHYWPLIKQRTRWCQGGIQCFKQYGRRIVASKQIKASLKIDILLLLALPFASLIYTLAGIISIIVFGHSLLVHLGATLIVLGLLLALSIIINGAMIYAAHLSAPTETYTTKQKVIILFLQPLYAFIQSPVVYISMSRELLGKRDWAKTAHYKHLAQPTERHDAVIQDKLTSSSIDPAKPREEDISQK